MSRLLTPEEITRQLGELPGWGGTGTTIERTLEAPDFRTAIAIVDAVADEAEQIDHHPDIDVRWRTLRFGLSTHVRGGVTQRDIELAHRIDQIAREHGAS